LKPKARACCAIALALQEIKIPVRIFLNSKRKRAQKQKNLRPDALIPAAKRFLNETDANLWRRAEQLPGRYQQRPSNRNSCLSLVQGRSEPAQFDPNATRNNGSAACVVSVAIPHDLSGSPCATGSQSQAGEQTDFLRFSGHST
jgi:hypothetical protein